MGGSGGGGGVVVGVMVVVTKPSVMTTLVSERAQRQLLIFITASNKHIRDNLSHLYSTLHTSLIHRHISAYNTITDTQTH